MGRNLAARRPSSTPDSPRRTFNALLAFCEQCFCLTCNRRIACLYILAYGCHRSCRFLVIELRICAGPELHLITYNSFAHTHAHCLSTKRKLNIAVATTNSEWRRVAEVRTKRRSGRSCVDEVGGFGQSKWKGDHVIRVFRIRDLAQPRRAPQGGEGCHWGRMDFVALALRVFSLNVAPACS